MGSFSTPAPLPEFKVRICRPDISPWVAGNTGITGITTRDSGLPGPHVALLSLMHGNEIAGAIVLDQLLRAGLVPMRGRLSAAADGVAVRRRRHEPGMGRDDPGRSAPLHRTRPV
jgi:hypothetical protein